MTNPSKVAKRIKQRFADSADDPTRNAAGYEEHILQIIDEEFAPGILALTNVEIMMSWLHPVLLKKGLDEISLEIIRKQIESCQEALEQLGIPLEENDG